uniref:Uncharacterized protein n=1 Tax=Brassica oleracea TaxID=3712 RepID=A0A3P6FPC7_BRAOL|nr:unnamed protein product [Brassica oleracea]
MSRRPGNLFGLRTDPRKGSYGRWGASGQGCNLSERGGRVVMDTQGIEKGLEKDSSPVVQSDRAGHTHGPDSPYGRLGRSVGTSEWVRVAKGHELPRGTCVQRVLVPKGCDFQTVTVVQGLGRTKWTVRGCIVEQTDDSFNRSVVSQGRIGCKAIRFGLGPYSVVWIQALARISMDRHVVGVRVVKSQGRSGQMMTHQFQVMQKDFGLCMSQERPDVYPYPFKDFSKLSSKSNSSQWRTDELMRSVDVAKSHQWWKRLITFSVLSSCNHHKLQPVQPLEFVATEENRDQYLMEVKGLDTFTIEILHSGTFWIDGAGYSKVIYLQISLQVWTRPTKTRLLMVSLKASKARP